MDLAALLVEEGAVSAADLERALARQREAGGALDTALLELGLIDEARLVGALSRATNLPAAPASAWDAADARARRVFPSRVAERHGLAPFALDGRELSLVATHPVDLGLLDEISFMLSLHLTAHVGPEWRVRALIHRLYGGALEPRMAAVASRPAPAAGRVPVPAAAAALKPEANAEDEAARGPETPPAVAGEDFGSVDLDISEDAPGAEVAVREPPAPPPMVGFAREAGEPLEPLAAALAQALESGDFPWLDEEVQDLGPAAPRAAELPPEPPGPPPERSAPPRWSVQDARAALAEARGRDGVVVSALRYARDFFEFAAVFAVTRDAVAGHDALGTGEEARDLARSTAIYASDPGIFHTVIETRAPYLGPVQRDAPGNEAILRGLGRGAPRTVLVYPVLLRDRPVCVLYADNGEAPVSPRRLGDLLLVLAAVGPSLERVIRARKRSLEAPAAASSASAPAPVPPHTDGVSSGPVAAAETGLAVPGPANEPEPAISSGAGSSAESPPTLEAKTDLAVPALEAKTELAIPAVEAKTELAIPAVEAKTEAAVPVFIEVRPEPQPMPSRTAPVAAAPDPEARRPRTPTPDARPTQLPHQVWRRPEPEPAFEVERMERPDAPATLDPEGEVRLLITTGIGTPRRAESMARLAAAGEDALTALVAALPGPVEEEGAHDPVRLGPIPAALALHGAQAVPQLVAVLQDPDPTRRRAAAVLLGAAAEPAAFGPLADRALDPEPRVAAAAAEALDRNRAHSAMRGIPDRLRRALLSGMAARSACAARALAGLRDVESIPLFIQVLETSPGPGAEAAAEALTRITLQRFGADARRWVGWWKENRGRGRAEWLFTGLTSADREARVAAAAELSLAAPAPVAYSPDASPADRESAARAWAGWWSRSGKVL